MCARPLVLVKMIRLVIPTILVPMASLLGSLGSPCGLSHDDLDCTRIHIQTNINYVDTLPAQLQLLTAEGT